MKKIISILFITTLSAQAQVSKYDYLCFCDQLMVNTNNSVPYLQGFYADLKQFKQKSSFRFRYFDSYNFIRQPDESAFKKINSGPNSNYKTTALELWKLYNQCYQKNGEIIAYLRLEDYKTDIEKGFGLVREMQQLQIAMGNVRDQLATKIATEAAAMPASNNFVKSYQLFMKAILHEEDLIRKLSRNFNEERFVGFAQEEILKSFLETDDLLKTLSAIKLPGQNYFNNCVEGLQQIQKAKQHALDNFSNEATFDGLYANQLYDNLQNYFNNDILHFYSNFCAQSNLTYYPMAFRQYDFDAPLKPWTFSHLSYSPAILDSLRIGKQPAALPVAGFTQLNAIVHYIDECVGSMENLFMELRSEGSTWNSLRRGKMPYKNPVLKFDKFRIPISMHGLILKESKNLPASYRSSLINRVNDMQQIMLALQDHLIELSQYLSSGTFRGKNIDYIDTKLKTIETLYTELDSRKEILFLEVRKAYAAHPPLKRNAWTVTASALLKATDDSRKILKQVDQRVYEQNQSPISVTAIHEDQRDLISNQLNYMKGIVRIGRYNGLCPYTPYEYIPDYLKTLEEKVTNVPTEVEDKNKTYGDFLYMHNNIVNQYNKFAELALGENEYSTNDPMRPVYILSYIQQPPKYHHEIPKPEIKIEQPSKVEDATEVKDNEVISFEGYPFNNLVLLLDVSGSMNQPERLPLLKKSFQQLVRLMRTEDEVSIVIYSGTAILHLPPVSATDTVTIMQSIQTLRSEGNTNIVDGLTLAYKTANKNFIKEGNNKIILATDGDFKTAEALYKLVEKNASKITLSVFDFSQLANPIVPLQTLAEKGSGSYVKVTKENSLSALAKEAQKSNLEK
ncbi:MAG: VWA domain-containing protein [Cyclobacteriaceae bacterium]|nr:VWA domain-containing protein [Cyclobacteriaceae bacterium]